MNNFASTLLNSPTVSTTRAALRFLFDNAGSPEMTRFYMYIALGCVAALLGERLTVRAVRRLLKRSQPDIVERIADALRMPLCLLIFSYFFILAFDAIKEMPPELWSHVHSDLYPLLNGLLILICSFRLVDIIAQVLRKRWEGDNTPLDERWADLIGWVGKTIVSLGAGLFIIQKLDPLFNIIPVLTGLSFIGAAVALASQKTIANAIGSMEIMVDRLFKEGDRISFDDYDGFVIRMGLRSITLAALTGEKINLPNKDLVDKQIHNHTRGKFNRTTITLGLRYDQTRADLERALALMDKIVRANHLVDQCDTSLRRFGDNYVELQALFWADYKTSPDYNKLMSGIQLELKEAFDQNGISFAFPAQTVYLKKEGQPPA